MLIVGLTGSIGMGKSFTANLLKEMEIPVFEADGVVHQLLSEDTHAADAILKEFPKAATPEGIDRKKLGEIVFSDRNAKKRLESILHPLILKEQRRFLTQQRLRAEPLVVLDIPLLYELGWEKHCDVVMVVSAPEEMQRRRVLAREGMTESRLNAILKNQMPSREKEARAQYVIDTSLTKSGVVKQLKRAIADMIDKKLKKKRHARPDA